jgi:hypothetical protein
MNQAEAKQMGLNLKGTGWFRKTMASSFIRELGPNAPRSISGSEWKAAGYIS